MVKLTNKRVKWLINQVVNMGKKSSEIASVYGVTPRRVQQLVKEYRETKKYPELKKERRPKVYLSHSEKEIIEKVFLETKLSARFLYYELKQRGYKIAKNKIYDYLKSKGYAKPNPRKQKKRKRCRYERKHSGSLVHGDSHRTSVNHPYCILWMDDASRKILGGLESEKPITNETSIKSLKQAIANAKEFNCRIYQVNTDRGPEFFSNKKSYNKKSLSKFEIFLKEQGIQHVLSRVNNPQSNGKLERHWLEYDRHRWRFKTLNDYIVWYNNRLHGALTLEWAETPNQAFIRKLRPESLLGLMFK